MSYSAGFQACKHNNLTLIEEIDYSIRQRTDCFDIFFDDFMPDDLDDTVITEILKRKKPNFFYTIHSPIRDYIEYNELLHSLIGTANRIGVKIIVFHFDRMTLDILTKIRSELDPSILLAVENVIPDWNPHENLNYIDFMKKASQINGITSNPDFGHAAVNGQDPSGLLRSLIDLKIPVSSFHIHDNDRTRDSHLPLGAGRLPWEEIFKIIRENISDPVFIIEHWNDHLQSLNTIRQWMS